MPSPNSYAAQGKTLPPKRPMRETAGEPARVGDGDRRPAGRGGDLIIAARNGEACPVRGWVVPQAQVRWLGPGVAYYTPLLVEQIFRQALAGDLQSEWELFDLMKSTSPELSRCINQLKDDVLANGLIVKPAAALRQDPSDEAQARADFVEAALNSMTAEPAKDENAWLGTQRSLLEARFNGISVVEVDWEARPVREAASHGASPLNGASVPNAICPRATRWVHPAWYGYEHGPGNANLKLKYISQPGPLTAWWPGDTSRGIGYNWSMPNAWSDFPPHKFLVAVCKNKEAHPLGSALLHVLGFWWAASNFAGEYLFNLLQLFGQPIRIAYYDPNIPPADLAMLKNWLAAMGSAPYGSFPAGTKVEVIPGMENPGETVQMTLLKYYDTLCNKLILRQTLTSDASKEGGARALGEVHERVLGSLEYAVAQWLAAMCQPLLRSICILNYGDDTECPTLCPPTEQEDESEELSNTLNTLAQAGLEPTDEAIPGIAKRIGFDLQRAAKPDAGPGDPGYDPDSDLVTQRHLYFNSLKKNSQPAQASHPAPVFAAEEPEEGHWITSGGRRIFIADKAEKEKGQHADKPDKGSGRSGPAKSSPDSASHYVGRGAETIPGHDTAPGERTARIAAERARLLQWAGENGRVLTKKAPTHTEGYEHEVSFNEKSQRVIKSTKPEAWAGAGIAMGAPNNAATPSEYLDRLATHNRIFNDDVRLEGVRKTMAGPSIVTSQPFIRGRDAAPEEIDKYMAGKGFEKLARGAYTHEGEGIWVHDLHERNVKVDEAGNIHPIDPVIQRITPDFRRFLKEHYYRPIQGAEPVAHVHRDPTLPIVAARKAAVAAAYRGAMQPMRAAIESSTSPADLERRLLVLYPDWKPARLAAELEEALQLCAATGAAEAGETEIKIKIHG